MTNFNANDNWINHLETLLVRFSHLGIEADIALLSLVDAWALYLHLSRLAES